MKFLVESYLKEKTPYMVRNDGKIFEITEKSPDGIIAHPYILLMYPYDSENTSEEAGVQIEAWIDDFVGYHYKDLWWFYKNSRQSKVRELISDIVKTLLEDKNSNDALKSILIEIVKRGVNIENATTLATDLELWEALQEAHKLTNQEFLRIRTSARYLEGEGKDLFIRVGSRNFNWFPIVWEIVYDNRDWITTITVEADDQSGRYEEPTGTKIGGMSVEDFINLPGRPIIEDKE